MPDKKFYKFDDDGVSYWVVSDSLAGATDTLRRSGAEFGDPSTTEPPTDVRELSYDSAAIIKVDMEDGSPRRPLTTCNLGDWFCSEY